MKKGRTRRRVLLAAVTVVILYVCWAAWLLAPIHRGAPLKADAIVMLAGADDGRHDLAEQLLDDGYAPELYVSHPPSAGKDAGTELCRIARTHCFDPSPRTTIGEAAYIAPIARDEGWTRIDLVTNQPHAFRAGTFFRHCLPGVEVRVVSIDHIVETRLPVHVAREAAGFAKNAASGLSC